MILFIRKVKENIKIYYRELLFSINTDFILGCVFVGSVMNIREQNGNPFKNFSGSFDQHNYAQLLLKS